MILRPPCRLPGAGPYPASLLPRFVRSDRGRCRPGREDGGGLPNSEVRRYAAPGPQPSGHPWTGSRVGSRRLISTLAPAWVAKSLANTPMMVGSTHRRSELHAARTTVGWYSGERGLVLGTSKRSSSLSSCKVTTTRGSALLMLGAHGRRGSLVDGSEGRSRSRDHALARGPVGGGGWVVVPGVGLELPQTGCRPVRLSPTYPL